MTPTHTDGASGPGARADFTACTTAPPATSTFEYYEIDDEVGRGGVGIVVRAHDRRLGRKVALKQLHHPGLHARHRFEREMRITARLQHPGVVPIHEAGTTASGEPFYAMKLVEGRSLKELIAERRRVEERLGFLPQLLAVVETMAYAHSMGVIHRDLKPSNVIIGAHGETVVIDWGLAKDLAEPDDAAEAASPHFQAQGDGLTLTGQVIGTPMYMPLEQASGGQVDRRADVYALGAILRQLLTGHPPYASASSHEVLRSVLSAPPPDLAEVAPEAPRDLVAVARKAMAREAADRYPDAAALLVDLRHFLNGRLVGAYAYAPAERLRKWAARRRGVLATAAIAAVVLLVVAGLALARIVHERDAALASRRAAVAERNALVREQAARELDQGNAVRAFEILKAYPRDATDWADVYPLVHRIGLAGLPDFWAKSAIVASPQTRMAIDDAGRVAIASAARLEVWSYRERRLVHAVDLGGDVTTTLSGIGVVTAEGRESLAVVVTDGAVHVVDAATWAPARTLRPCGKGRLWDSAVVPGGAALAVACINGAVVRLDLATGATAPLQRHDGPANSVALQAGGVVVSVGADGQVRWSTGRTRALGGALTSLAARPGCDVAVVGTATGQLVVLPPADADEPRRYTVDAGASVKVVGLDAGCRLAFGLTTTDTLLVVDLATGQPIHSGKAKMATFHHDRPALVIASASEGRIEYWEPGTGWRQSWRPSTKPLWYMDVAADGTLASFGDDVAATYAPGRIPDVVALRERGLTLALADDESHVVVGGARGGVTTVDLTGATPVVADDRPAVHDGVAYVMWGGHTLYSVGARDGCLLRWRDDGTAEPVTCMPGGVIAIQTFGDERAYVGSPRGVVGVDHGRLVAAGPYSGLKRIGVDERAEHVLVSTNTGGVDVLDPSLARLGHVEVGRPMGLAWALASGPVVAVAEDGSILDLDGPTVLGRYWPLGGGCGGGEILRAFLASEADRVIAGCQNGAVVTWPAVPGFDRLVHPQIVMDVDTSPDGTVLVAGSRAGTLTVTDTTAASVRSTSAGLGLTNLEYVPTRHLVVAVTQEPSTFAAWKVEALAAPYPLTDDGIYEWLHANE